MDKLETDFTELEKQFPSASMDRRADGSALITIRDFPLKTGWNTDRATILFVVPVGYPLARPDTFWADEGLRLSHGGMPANSGLNANYGAGPQRLWFSFHPGAWNPNRDNLVTYARLIRRRLEEAR